MSQRRSVASRNARPSATWVSTRGSSYGRSGWVLPTSSRCSSISTASTDVAPRARATATSLPEPAPMISTSPGEFGRESLVHRLVQRVADRPELQPRGNSVDLGDDAAGVADRSWCAPCSTASRSCPVSADSTPSATTSATRGIDDDGDRGTPPRTNGDEQSSGRDRPPHHRFGVEERQHGEGDDAEQAADEVELVGVEVAEAGERAGHTVTEAGHHDRDGDEDHRQHDPTRRARGVEAEEDEVAAGDADPHVEEAGQHDEGGERRRGDHEQRT